MFMKFGIIQKILCTDCDKILFVCKLTEIQEFVDHYQALKINLINELKLFEITDLSLVYSTNIKKLSNGDLYVNWKFLNI